MILDTNILLRLIDGAEHPQHREVRERLESALARGERLHVTQATIHEVAYVLASDATGYGYDRRETADEVRALLDSVELSVERAEVFRLAVDRYTATRLAFHDCYLAALAATSHEALCTLDQELGRETATPRARPDRPVR